MFGIGCNKSIIEQSIDKDVRFGDDNGNEIQPISSIFNFRKLGRNDGLVDKEEDEEEEALKKKKNH